MRKQQFQKIFHSKIVIWNVDACIFTFCLFLFAFLHINRLAVSLLVLHQNRLESALFSLYPLYNIFFTILIL